MFPPLKNFNLQDWIKASKGNWGAPPKPIFEGSDYVSFVVRGPSTPRDFHINPGEEIFYMLEGELNFHYVDAHDKRNVLTVGPGEIFLLPANVPHSPQRLEGSWGLVIERKRRPGEFDRQVWLCEACNHILYETTYRFEVPADAMRAVQEGNNALLVDVSKRTCRKCGTIFDLSSRKPE
jgi:3-hydroxyanthranilate 3,4-dioxygenase